MRKVWVIIGFLISVSAAWAEPVRITAFGDSLVQGYGLPQGDGFVPQLEHWLQEHGAEVEITNAGVSGDTSAGGAARIDWTLADDPDALIVLLGGNDLLRGLSAEEMRANLSKILSAAQQADTEVLLVGMRAPNNYGPDYRAAFNAVYPDLAKEFGALLHPDAFAGIFKRVGGDPAKAQEFMQDDDIHPNAEGVRENIEALGPVALQLVARVSG
ncbi:MULTISPECIES: arylesterase [Phaeobacter]|uniref:arylesterase n=1 Tax=Phaeobacter TaxID=302485 RepID=UPI00237F51F2|nr:arylesterase [Phaeobacter gallaeciensis]MDE4190778.1 arylesterase [Phaeobacter gallaeciensis]MDE4197729.1 arylesterase [Phaeobacter gallaeciensis]MDE4201871.1 arylesterase [Phaeobacter gallaeciensis]MDE4206829.1 arylesterase [Phaeobacter gallaeciensis]MDE4215197.1 arylesterase [Phaeobacter gallaeciensis]